MVIVSQATDLLDRVSAGDPEAFAELVRPHLASLLGFSTRVAQDAAVAEDALQDVLAQAFRTLQRKPRADLERLAVRPWLYRSVINRVRRLRGRRRDHPVGLSAIPAEGDAQLVVGQHALLALVDQELHRLPRDWRAAILLRHHAGYPYEEVAAILQRPAGTVKAWVHRGTRRVRDGVLLAMPEGLEE